MPTTRQDFRLFHRLRVRWAEVDMQKIVFNGHYLMYFDTAMADYWRALALPYEHTMHALGGDLYVKKASVEYHASARYDDQLDVGLKCQRIGTSSIQFVGAIFCGEQLLINSELIYVYANPATQTSLPVPPRLRDIFLGFEAGEAVTQCQVGTWQDLQAHASAVRTEVFVQEQGIAAEEEWDDADATAVHAVVRNGFGLPLGTARLLQPEAGVAQIGRMAVTRLLRGSGLGQQLLQALMQQARARGDHEVRLHAQRSAQGFYARQGFANHGEPFDEVGIAHIEMRLALG
ncbi:4-hydroxybenzoyl-CoA thioesterase [Limnohabitans sp. TS-CS-82]|uniref:YbgC/FadM family acyl-CoA thioesterase n=1 Tax=Limnohabitans sp. TS-CS-82 TaxID=2094193 RepID=UPI000CF253E4|nr:YbgC/FadM family acyl-CoA thioesterase [Limnohabitans sp. TS-CS-82]PQA82857.1 4-hydroxybenzoyl-CoA thioesterase [Limnohabitans sp. TS-CS-82]